MRKNICRYPSCNTLIEPNTTYCSEHIPPKRIPFKNAIRTNEKFYSTTRWRKLRKKILAETPYCIKCGADSGLEIHHKIPPRGDIKLFYNDDNCVPVCGNCHKRATANEILNRKSTY